jgi:hypothetical protein
MSLSLRPISLAGLVLVLGAACAPAAARTPGGTAAAASSLEAEARAFMASYAADLLAGNRDGIADRYDPRGAWLVGEGRKTFVSLDSIRAQYRDGWRPPVSFEWQDLSYEVTGPDAVVVVGRFVWGASATQRFQYSYTSLLLRQEGRLRIRLEDESGAPPPR